MNNKKNLFELVEKLRAAGHVKLIGPPQPAYVSYDTNGAKHNDQVEAATKALIAEIKFLILSVPGFDQDNFEIEHRKWWDNNFRPLRASLSDEEYDAIIKRVRGEHNES